MHYLWWTLTMILMFFGLGATLLPMLPGTTIILASAVLHRLLLGAEHSVSWKALIGLAVLTVISYIIELMSGTVGAKWFGATRWGAIGGTIGAIVGMFFGVIGIFVGPLVGVMIGELLGGKELLPATKTTWGSLLGTTAGIVGKLVLGTIMVLWFFLALRH